MSKALRRQWRRTLQPLFLELQERFQGAAPQHPQAFFEASLCERFREVIRHETRDLHQEAFARLAQRLRLPVQWEADPAHGRPPALALQTVVCQQLASNALWRANHIAYLQTLVQPLFVWFEELEAQDVRLPETLFRPVFEAMFTAVRYARRALTELEDPATPANEARAWKVHDMLQTLRQHIKDVEACMTTFREYVPGALQVLEPQAESVDQAVHRTFDRVLRLGLSAGPPPSALKMLSSVL